MIADVAVGNGTLVTAVLVLLIIALIIWIIRAL